MVLRRDVIDLIRNDDLAAFVLFATPQEAVAIDETVSNLFGSYLHICSEKNRVAMAEHLLKVGADVNRLGGLWKATPMTYAAADGHVEMVKLLREHGGEFDINDDPIRNPLTTAVRRGHIDVVKYLLEAGCDPHVTFRNDRGKLRNAFLRATEDKRTDIVQLLESYGCRAPIEGVDKPVWEMPREEPSDETSDYDQIVEYMAERFGPVDELGLQEILPVVEDMSVTINVIPPNDEHPFLVLFTNGMSSRAMTGDEDWQYAELVMHLPPDWPHPREAGGDSPWFWPVQCLRRLAYHPHLNNTWFGPPASIVATNDPPEPLGPNTQQTSVLLVPRFANLSLPLELNDGRVINFFTVVPLHTAERSYAIEHGIKAFFQRFIEHRVPMTFEKDRSSFVLPFAREAHVN